MEMYTGSQWLLIDLAAMYGLDKKTYSERLDWGRKQLPKIQDCPNIKTLSLTFRPLIIEADEPEMFSACLISIFDTVKGRPSGYLVGLDAASSGPQLLSVLTRCITGMLNTGAIFNGSVPDLYTTIRNNIIGCEANRKSVKQATVPYMYGSKKEPEKVFGETDVDKFYEACASTVPLAEIARGELMGAWNSTALFHEWDLPDGGIAHCKVLVTTKYTGKFDGHEYTYQFEINAPIPAGERGTMSLAANVTHSYDAYVLRELHRRCNYNPIQLKTAIKNIELHLKHGSTKTSEKLHDLAYLALRHECVSIVAIEHVRWNHMADIPLEYLEQLLDTLQSLLPHKPFIVRTIHDEFACPPNNCNRMRQVYNILLAEAYESSWLLNTIESLGGTATQLRSPINPEITALLLDNNYAIN